MSIINYVQFRNLDGSDLYPVPYNPFKFDPVDSSDYEMIKIIDGSPVRSVSSFDDRVRTMEWPFNKTSNATFSGMLSELKSYVGQLKQLNLGDIDTYSWGWRNIRILDVVSQLADGGELKKNIVLTFVFTQSY
jgi:hypothetical protein